MNVVCFEKDCELVEKRTNGEADGGRTAKVGENEHKVALLASSVSYCRGGRTRKIAKMIAYNFAE
jgi:hypothetical protein